MKNRNCFKAVLIALTPPVHKLPTRTFSLCGCSWHPQREKDVDTMCIAGSFIKRLEDFLIGKDVKF
jgi:hypothetical protein